MGLDVALGAIILLGALRGWFRGFSSQAVRLIGLVACFYLALPVREQARPYILARMPAIEPALLDRILWWVAAVVSYVVLVGLLTLAIQLMKSPPNPESVHSRRGDRFGGLLLGAAKAALVAALLAAGVEKYGADVGRNFPWAERQVIGSHALEWTAQYQPIPRLWATAPVRSLFQQIQRNGLRRTPDVNSEKQVAERERTVPESSNRAPRLDLPPAEVSDPTDHSIDDDLGEDVVRDLERIKQEVSARKSGR